MTTRTELLNNFCKKHGLELQDNNDYQMDVAGALFEYGKNAKKKNISIEDISVLLFQANKELDNGLDNTQLNDIYASVVASKVYKPEREEDLHVQVSKALAELKKSRADDKERWLQVGMAVHSALPDTGLPLWETWSKQSDKYQPGVCWEKWQSFHVDEFTIEDLLKWAEDDSDGKYIRPCPKDAKPSDYVNALRTMGYSFSMNSMNDRVYINGNLLSDGVRASLLTNLREHDYKNESWAEDAWTAAAFENQFHPIKDYLENLVWDGEDHISKLCNYFKDADNIFPLLIRKWLVGAVNKIYGRTYDRENPMLVLDGVQNIGKSIFVAWLGSPLPEYYIVSPIYPDNKDHVIAQVSNFVWEVEELGSTFRKADRESLKAFVTRPWASYRPPYGRYEIKKGTTCSFIGTLNDEGGFLTDPTGNRRFRVCNLESIDWDYPKNVDINQVWAQAVSLAKNGETSNLSKQENELINEIQGRYEVEDPLAYYIYKYFEIDKNNQNWNLPTQEIISILKAKGVVNQETDRQVANRVSTILVKNKLNKYHRRNGSNPVRGWIGISPRLTESEKNVNALFGQ